MNVWMRPTRPFREHFGKRAILLILLDLAQSVNRRPVTALALKWQLLSAVVEASGSMVMSVNSRTSGNPTVRPASLIPASFRRRANPYLIIAGCEHDGAAMHLQLQAKYLGIPVSLVHDALSIDGKTPSVKPPDVPRGADEVPMYVTTAEILGWLLPPGDLTED